MLHWEELKAEVRAEERAAREAEGCEGFDFIQALGAFLQFPPVKEHQ